MICDPRGDSGVRAVIATGSDVRGEQKPDLLGFRSVRDPEGFAAALPPVEAGGAI